MKKNNNKDGSSGLFKKNLKGEIVIVGSGKYLREQKERFSKNPCSDPFEELYKQQVNEVIKNSSEELRSCFTL